MIIMIKPMLAKNYKDQNIDGWLMSEKLDGVRCIFDGEKFYSRNGKVFHAPDWFFEGMPKGIVLDGELYGGLGQFQKTCGIVRRHDDQWDNVKFMVFDTIDNMSLTFSVRSQKLKSYDIINVFPEHVKLVEQITCLDKHHLDAYEETLAVQGCEGVMIKNPDSLYQYKRSSDLLKVKRFKSDECVLRSYQDGNGKHKGRVGAFICEWQGKRIKLGTGLNDDIRIDPPKIGSVLTFTYFELTDSGVPRFPAFVEVRNYE